MKLFSPSILQDRTGRGILEEIKSLDKPLKLKISNQNSYNEHDDHEFQKSVHIIPVKAQSSFYDVVGLHKVLVALATTIQEFSAQDPKPDARTVENLYDAWHVQVIKYLLGCISSLSNNDLLIEKANVVFAQIDKTSEHYQIASYFMGYYYLEAGSLCPPNNEDQKSYFMTALNYFVLCKNNLHLENHEKSVHERILNLGHYFLKSELNNLIQLTGFSFNDNDPTNLATLCEQIFEKVHLLPITSKAIPAMASKQPSLVLEALDAAQPLALERATEFRKIVMAINGCELFFSSIEGSQIPDANPKTRSDNDILNRDIGILRQALKNPIKPPALASALENFIHSRYAGVFRKYLEAGKADLIFQSQIRTCSEFAAAFSQRNVRLLKINFIESYQPDNDSTFENCTEDFNNTYQQ